MQDLTKRRHTTLSSLSKFLEHGMKRLETAIAVFIIFVQVACPVPLSGWESWGVLPAEAVLYSPETKLPRTGELALRRAIPANTSMKAIQVCHYFLRSPSFVGLNNNV